MDKVVVKNQVLYDFVKIFVGRGYHISSAIDEALCCYNRLIKYDIIEVEEEEATEWQKLPQPERCFESIIDDDRYPLIQDV